jgi:hypothetical protein
MPNPWDYKSDQRQNVNWGRKYYIVLADESSNPLYEYARVVGKVYSRFRSTRKAHFVKLGEPIERVYFMDFQQARRAMIEIGSTAVSNVPIGRYHLLVVQTFENEPVACLPYYVKKEVKDVPN